MSSSIDMWELVAWGKEWAPRETKLKELHPPHIQKKSAAYKRRWNEIIKYHGVPFKNREGRLYYFIVYIVAGPEDVGYVVLDEQGEAVPWDEAYPVAVQSLVYRRLVEKDVFWDMRRIVSGKFVRRIRTILRELRKLQAVAEKSGEVEVEQSIEQLLRDHEISLEYGLLAEEGYRLGKEHVDAVLARGYATEKDVRALYRMVCEKLSFPAYRNMKKIAESEKNYDHVKRFMWKNLWRLVVRNPFGTWGLWNYISIGTTDEERHKTRVALDSYEVHPVTKERRTFALQKEMMGEYCENEWRTSVAAAEMTVRKMLRNPKVAEGDGAAGEEKAVAGSAKEQVGAGRSLPR
ncbi:MAG: hypothetical protein HSCHL_1738 [Hydrogenibacillus schlegelii]|uniref:Uncharacterized protein n=1 Tax=Hydrogenibacillus schlegelii TaxID=1484 RepID=A0A2T5GBJ5_HYDSH|nr:hypothetical protein [Hydrogenibacillus schlegelii]PTQ53561.1 MAG: hypothetical protein HSCHL_1738 [Hydrogenibacillus schlegelii]